MNNNFLDILFYLFIIYIILSPFFKKKDKDEKKSPSQRSDNNIDLNSNYENETAAYSSQLEKKPDNNDEILKELENIFKDQQNNNAPVKRRSTKIEVEKAKQELAKRKAAETSSLKNDSYSTYSDWGNYSESNTLQQQQVIREQSGKFESNINEEAARFEEMLAKDQQVESRLMKSVKDNIHNPQSLKQYIVISEILGKPKALRR